MCCNIKSFCGLNLRSGGVVIGWVSAVLSLLQSILCIACLANMDGIMNIVKDVTNVNYTYMESIRTAISVVLSVRLGIAVLDTITSILIIIGTHKNSHLMFLPWLINNIIDLVLKMIFIVISVCVMPLALPLLPLIFWGIQCYAWIAIQSQYQNIRERRGEDHIYLN